MKVVWKLLVASMAYGIMSLSFALWAVAAPSVSGWFTTASLATGIVAVVSSIAFVWEAVYGFSDGEDDHGC